MVLPCFYHFVQYSLNSYGSWQNYFAVGTPIHAFPMNEYDEKATMKTIRGFLLIIFLIGVFGAGGELLLLGHTEDFRQWIPLALMSLSLIVLGWRIVDRRRTSLRIFQLIMLLFVASGFVGMFLHYRANVEFKLEMYPAMKGLELFEKAIKGKTPPTLAPGAMIQLGLIGLAYAYRHPALIELNSKREIEES
jgi:hypothetical protein